MAAIWCDGGNIDAFNCGMTGTDGSKDERISNMKRRKARSRAAD